MSLLVSTVSFPLGTGMYFAGDLTTHQQVMNFFSNFTWTHENLTADQHSMVKHWQTPHSGVFVSLICYVAYTVNIHII